MAESRLRKFEKKYLIQLVCEVALVVGLVGVDLLSKYLAFSFLEKQGGSYVVLKGIFTMIEAKNYGASFSVLAGKTGFLIAITTLASIFVSVVLFLKKKAPLTFRLSLVLILGGALGNLIDRIALGYVRDFIDYTFLYTFFKIDFAIGNIADIFLMVGIFLLIVYIVFEFKEEDLFKIKPEHSSEDNNEKLDNEVSGGKYNDGDMQ